MWRAMAVLPTNEIASTSGWVRSASTASASPCTTVCTPSGNPASRTSSASNNDADGSFSDGLCTNALPHASALASIHIGTITGKLNGVTPATTPTGWSTVCTSMPADTSELCAPFRRCGMPHANSTQSSPRATSPRASSSTLPCSAVISAARSSRRASTSSRRRNIATLRRLSDESRHSAAAATATLTAASTSADEANATSAVCTPRAGSKTGPRRAAAPSTRRPPIQCPMVSTGVRLRLEAVELTGVLAVDLLLRLHRQRRHLVLHRRERLGVEAGGVREVGLEEDAVLADRLDEVGQLVARVLEPERGEHVRAEVLRRHLLHLGQLVGRVFRHLVVERFEHERDPADATLDRDHLQLGEPVEHARQDDVGEHARVADEQQRATDGELGVHRVRL